MPGRREGALVAFEAARLLAAAGREVELVALVDPVGIAPDRSARPLSTFLAWVMDRKHRDGAAVAATYAPSAIQVPLLVFSTALPAALAR